MKPDSMTSSLTAILDVFLGGCKAYRQSTGVDWLKIRYGGAEYWRRESEVYRPGFEDGDILETDKREPKTK